ncbi:MAG: hypothetical protein KAT68_14590 [Bacteroidales bacterium]|nr:hypothetical protein [Bacteroidales bacterium]
MDKKINISIGLVSSSVIAFQLVLLQILEFTQWYHFAYMIISIALLGFGASGTIISLFSKRLLKNIGFILPILMFLCGLSMTIVLMLSQTEFFRFDTYLFFSADNQVFKLVAVYILYFLPFFFGALAIGLVFCYYPEKIGKLYFFNLVGSGIGGIIVPVLSLCLFPQQIVSIISFIPIVGGLMIIPKKYNKIYSLIGIFSIITVTIFFFNPVQLNISQFKSLKKTLSLPESKVILKKSSPYGTIHVVSSPVIRYAPCLSLNYTGNTPVTDLVFINGNSCGAILSPEIFKKTEILDYTTRALPYSLIKPNNVLILNSGTGEEISNAISKNIPEIVGVEPNITLFPLLKNELARETGFLFDYQNVTMVNLNSRSFIAKDTSKYDLIILPVVNSFGGNAGIDALKEEYLFSKESFIDIWNKLSYNGILSITCWLDYPARYPLKIISTISEMLEYHGIKNPVHYIGAVRNWGTITFIVKKSKIDVSDIKNIMDFCTKNYFDPVLFPGISEKERNKYNILQDTLLFSHFDKILSTDRQNFYSEYLFNIKPATDNQPFFNQFLKLKNFFYFKKILGSRNAPFIETAYIFLIFTLIQIIFLALILIIVPLLRLGWNSGNKLGTLLYFGGIGIGYMFIEIVLIQRTLLYFDKPLFSVAVVLCIMLIFSGIGSYYSIKIKQNKRKLFFIIGVIVLLLLIYSVLFTVILKNTVELSIIFKLIIFIILIAPLSFFMGMPFPLGIKYLSLNNKNIIPWAWGINGCFSVVSTVLATIIAIEAGFVMVFLFAALAYFLTLFSKFK